MQRKSLLRSRFLRIVVIISTVLVVQAFLPIILYRNPSNDNPVPIYIETPNDTPYITENELIDDPIAVEAPNCEGELLYNWICLPSNWPPRYRMWREKPNPNIPNLARAESLFPYLYDDFQPPYLASPPPLINITIGRQLFVDDFLIEYTNMSRVFHQPTEKKIVGRVEEYTLLVTIG